MLLWDMEVVWGDRPAVSKPFPIQLVTHTLCSEMGLPLAQRRNDYKAVGFGERSSGFGTSSSDFQALDVGC